MSSDKGRTIYEVSGGYMSAAQIDALGGSMDVTVEKAQTELIGQKKEEKIVVYFEGINNGLILNKVNRNTLADVAGNPYFETGWAGTQLRLFTAECGSPNGPTRGIRIRRVA